MNANLNLIVYLKQLANLLDILPPADSNSHCKGYYIHSRESRTKPSFANVTGWGWVTNTLYYPHLYGSGLAAHPVIYCLCLFTLDAGNMVSCKWKKSLGGFEKW